MKNILHNFPRQKAIDLFSFLWENQFKACDSWIIFETIIAVGFRSWSHYFIWQNMIRLSIMAKLWSIFICSDAKNYSNTFSQMNIQKENSVHHNYCTFCFLLRKFAMKDWSRRLKNISLISYHFQIIVLFQFQDHMAVDTWRSYRSLHVLHGRQSRRVPEV